MTKYKFDWIDERHYEVVVDVDETKIDYDGVQEIIDEKISKGETTELKHAGDVWGGDIINVSTGKVLDYYEIKKKG